jgi:lysophospholipase L1-like esterase
VRPDSVLELADLTGTTVEWLAVGETGARATRVRTGLVEELPPGAFDIILVSVGVNDVTGLVRSGAWTREVGFLLDALRAHSPRAVVVMAGLPPMWGFPLLPRPLRYVFGVRAWTFDDLLRRVVAVRDR